MRQPQLPWWFGVSCGLGFVVVANVVLITLALEHPSVVVPRPAGGASATQQQHNEEYAQAREAGWRVATAFDPARGRTTVEVTDATGARLSGLVVTARGGRANDSREDFELVLKPRPDGRYAAELPRELSGTFLVDIEVRRDDAAIRQRHVLTLPAQRTQASEGPP